MQNTEAFQNDLVRNTELNNGLILSLILLSSAYVIVRLIYHRYWKRYRQALFFNQEAVKLLQEKNVLLLQAAVSMNILATFSIGLFAQLFILKMELFSPYQENILGWVIATLVVMVAIGGKYLFNNFLGRSGDNLNAAVQVNHQWLINLKNFGFILLPFSVVAAFIGKPLENIVLYVGLGVVVFLLILNYIKGFLILFQNRISIFYGILYLCTLEILPVLIVWKVIRLMM